jgi:hypothetical protein
MESDKKDNYNKKKILDELISKQLKTVNLERKLYNKDLRRIVKYIDMTIFDENKCCMWNGYVTNEANAKRGTYVNFFFRNKKVALHRLLYENFVGVLGEENYLKFSCDDYENCGKCCNINHMIKYKYNNQKDYSKTSNNNAKKSSNVEDINKADKEENNKDTECNKNDVSNNVELKKTKKKKSKNFLNDNLTLSFD